MSATGSAPARRRLKSPTRAPIRSITVSRPVRVGLMPTPRRVSPDPCTIVAATTNGAADEKSPGTTTSSRCRLATGDTATRPGRRSTGAPAWRSIRSVWSRVATGSSTTVTPRSAKRPASSTHDFTWAEATGSR